MDNDDRVNAADLTATRLAVSQIYRRVLLTTGIVSLACSVAVALLVFYLKAPSISLSVVIGGIFLLLGLFVAIHWVRHYRSIYRQLDALEARVQSGEEIYGSKHKFHSYK